jgi:DNA-binding transcriptional LysR family regulator
MSLRQMEYLLAVVEEGSFTRAAHRLEVSQPALSHQVRALERSVGEQLLERLHDSVRLTPMGRAYLPHAIAALRSAHEAWQVGRRGGMRISLRVASLYSLTSGLMPAAIRAWRRSYPEADVEVLEFANFEDMADRMALSVADVAVGPLPPHWKGRIREIGIEEIVVVLATDDPFVTPERRTIRLTELANRSWVLYSPDNALTPTIAQEYARIGVNPRAAVRTHHAATAAQLAAAGLGPALVPRGIIEDDFPGVVLEPVPPIRRRLVAITQTDEPHHVSVFVELLAEHVAERFQATPVNA